MRPTAHRNISIQLHHPECKVHTFVQKLWADTRCIISSVSTVWTGVERSLTHIQTASSVNYHEPRRLVCILRYAVAYCSSICGGIASLANKQRDLRVPGVVCMATGGVRQPAVSTIAASKTSGEVSGALHSCHLSMRWSTAAFLSRRTHTLFCSRLSQNDRACEAKTLFGRQPLYFCVFVSVSVYWKSYNVVMTIELECSATQMLNKRTDLSVICIH